MGEADVAVVGGGPAGCAAALTLRAHAPGLRVVLLEASRYERPRIGETLPPAAAGVLRHLGVWDAFRADGHREAHGTAAAWGAAAPRERDYLTGVAGAGWHLDRARFDARLAGAAEGAGVEVRRGARLAGAEREGAGWRLRTLDGGTLRARWVVDATGPRAAFAGPFGGARRRMVDRLVGFARFFRDGAPHDPGTLVEAFADGWWYSAGLPGGLRVAACMTDADLAPAAALRSVPGWEGLLRATAPHTAERLTGARAEGALLVRAARSACLQPAAGDGWLAVGDAASVFDPLSAQGILKALRSGIFAGYAVGDRLARGDARGPARYADFVEHEFGAYQAARRAYYAAGARWDTPFWRRRAGGDAPRRAA